jgi:hypothetical protein
MEVYQSGRDDLAARVVHRPGVLSKRSAYRNNPPVREGDIGNPINGLGWIDDTPTLQNEIKPHGDQVLLSTIINR